MEMLLASTLVPAVVRMAENVLGDSTSRRLEPTCTLEDVQKFDPGAHKMPQCNPPSKQDKRVCAYLETNRYCKMR